MKKEYRVTIKVDPEKIKQHGIIGDPEEDEDWSSEENLIEAIRSSLSNSSYKDMEIEVEDVRYDDYGEEYGGGVPAPESSPNWEE